MRTLFPHLTQLRIENVCAAGAGVRIAASTLDGPVSCPGCGSLSARVHSRYQRRLLDTAIAGREMLLVLRVRRLFCANPDCAKSTFAEQIPGLAMRYARRTVALDRVLGAVALALGGRAGQRLSQHLAALVSRMTLLRMVRALPDPDRPTPRVLGVDDFALRRGHHYGTILIDIESRRPVDVLTDRTAQTLTAWLKAHPGVEIVCRDRASAYAEGAREGAPDAVQIADRWHIWHNLADAVERTVARHRDCLSAALSVPDDTDADENTEADGKQLSADDDPQPSAGPSDRTDRWAMRARERHAAVHALVAEGAAIRDICRRLGLARGTVRRFARATTVEELLARNGTGQRPSILEPFKPYLHQRWNEGFTNAAALFTEITMRGYRGGQNIVRQYLHQFRTAVRISRPPRKPLEAWMAAVDADDQPALRSFVLGLRRDQDAVTAGLTLPWSSGAVEGHVNRIKMLKRQMFGRAGPLQSDDHEIDRVDQAAPVLLVRHEFIPRYMTCR